MRTPEIGSGERVSDRISRVAMQGCLARHAPNKLTTALAQLIKARRFRKLDPCEQLGYIVVASYMRSPQLAEFMLKSTGNNMSLVQCLVDFFRETGGVAARKAFLPSRRVAAPAAPAAKRKADSVADVCQGGLRVIYQLIITKLTACLKWQALIKPNRDIAKMGLKDVLSMASQFLDGSLSELMLTQPRGQWQVDVDQRLDSRNHAASSGSAALASPHGSSCRSTLRKPCESSACWVVSMAGWRSHRRLTGGSPGFGWGR